MRAAILRHRAMVVDDIPDLVPQPGQVLVEVVACGICGSDLHTVDHGHRLAETAAAAGNSIFDFDPDRDLVMGHEVSVRVLEARPGDAEGALAPPSIRPGMAMAAMPHLVADGRRVIPGYDNTYPGGYCERMLLAPSALVPVPNGLDPVMAALTEPMAVGLHAVNQSSITPGRCAIVVGTGPVGLAIVAALSLAGAEPIIAIDFSPVRRAMATRVGAHVVIDPGHASSGAERGEAGFALAVDAWADHGGSTTGAAPPVVFEAVGVPGMIDLVMSGAPTGSEITVAGVCMEDDRFRPIMGIYKRLAIRFVLGWSPEEFVDSLHNLAEGRIDARAMITGHVPLDEVPAAFRDLARPDHHVKILVRPNGTS